MSITEFAYDDCLYGNVRFGEEITQLIIQPLVQRLRQIRLSNIDSLSMPAIAGLTRFEHSLGTAHLASTVGISETLSRDDQILIQAAALIHDTAITPFGHLVEEAFSYADVSFDHEAKWSVLLAGTDDIETGGLDLQVYLGLSSGLKPWVLRTFRHRSDEHLKTLIDAVNGRGKFGGFIVGEMDLDNLDNVMRIAYHMGIPVDRNLPKLISGAIIGIGSDGNPIFKTGCEELVTKWLVIREAVYNRLMPAEHDFVGKLMLLYAAVRALKIDLLSQVDWKLTDGEFLNRLLASTDREIVQTTRSWLLGDVWDLGPLLWLSGAPPTFADVGRFSDALSGALGRPCFAYRIKDKRKRRLMLHLSDGSQLELGEEGRSWLLGYGSPKKFTAEELDRSSELIRTFFNAESRPLKSGAPGLFDEAGV